MTRFDNVATPMPRWLQAKREASFAFLRRFQRTPPPSKIHHYTSSAALISIVENNEMWLSEATYLNDREEIELGRRLACERIKSHIEAEASAEVRAPLEQALSYFESRSDPQVYVVCFSFESDDLSQWRGYGGTEAPIAIELEYGTQMFGYTSEGTLEQVMYELEDQIWAFDNLIATYADAYRKDLASPIPFERHGPPLTASEEAEIISRSLYYALWNYIVRCKNSAFRSEREVRFIYSAHDYSQDLSSQLWHPEHPTPRFRERAGRVIPFLTSKNLDFENLPSSITNRASDIVKLPISSVMIGPTAEPVLIQRAVRRLLDTHGHHDATVTLSSSPFRPI